MGFEKNHQLDSGGVSREYFFKREMEEMEPEMLSLVKKMEDKLKKGSYEVIISQEVGGRIPALVLGKIAKSMSHKNLETFFLSDDIGRSDDLSKFIRNKKIHGRVLIVTEFVLSGRSLIEFIKKIKNGGISKYDIATVRVNGYFGMREIEEFIKKEGGSFYWGELRNYIPSFDEHSGTMSGVTRIRSSGIIGGAHPVRCREKDCQRNINSAREDIEMMAERVLKKLRD